MEIRIDHGTCIGSGQCTLTAPAAFTQDDDGAAARRPATGWTHGGLDARNRARVMPGRPQWRGGRRRRGPGCRLWRTGC
ncbi:MULTISPECIES: ferredoxin [unclassified Streptomyces]|uniref:ferredoxin n=1 Tax=unclassified Streptomyces TaxID=2593676 RepID=UPI0037F4602D